MILIVQRIEQKQMGERYAAEQHRTRYEGKVHRGKDQPETRRGGATAAFERLNMYFTMLNMHVVSSQYWNQVHGYTPDDVKKDIERLQTMRTLGQNMAYLLKAQKAAADSGIASA